MKPKSDKDFLFVELQVLLLWFHQTGDKKLVDKTVTSSSVFIHVVSMWSPVMSKCFYLPPSALQLCWRRRSVSTLRLICLLRRSPSCNNLEKCDRQSVLKPNKEKTIQKSNYFMKNISNIQTKLKKQIKPKQDKQQNRRKHNETASHHIKLGLYSIQALISLSSVNLSQSQSFNIALNRLALLMTRSR